MLNFYRTDLHTSGQGRRQDFFQRDKLVDFLRVKMYEMHETFWANGEVKPTTIQGNSIILVIIVIIF
ncbi:hypothetical protein DPMN_068132 [Dreissena polymorpha]|uniref:Uncharacterized protein n=1 Tax=Dreissena polymorpha TaxID=45954 RepID=A0A9D3YWJ8_DREPO|nr:hypothetical protein DPMN_068132 [Dreissena polymorpha]